MNGAAFLFTEILPCTFLKLAQTAAESGRVAFQCFKCPQRETKTSRFLVDSIDHMYQMGTFDILDGEPNFGEIADTFAMCAGCDYIDS